MKNNFKLSATIIFAAIVYIVIFLLLIRGLKLGDYVSTLERSNPVGLFFIMILSGAMIFAQGNFLKKVFSLYTERIDLKEATTIWLLTVPTGAITVGLSGPALIYYYANKKKLSSSQAGTCIILYFAIFTIVNLVLAIVFGGLSIYQSGIGLNAKVYLYAITTLIFIFIAFLSNKKIRNYIIKFLHTKFLSIIPQINEDLISIVPFNKMILIALSVLLAVFLNFSIFYFSFYATGIYLAPLLIIKVFVLSQMISIFSPSGGGLGFVELGLGGILTLTGLSVNESAIIVILYRLFEFWVPAFLGMYFFSVRGVGLIQRMSENQRK